MSSVATGRILQGDVIGHLAKIPAASVDLSFWSPPYFVGKSYERDWTFAEWCGLLRDVIRGFRLLLVSTHDTPSGESGKSPRVVTEAYSPQLEKFCVA